MKRMSGFPAVHLIAVLFVLSSITRSDVLAVADDFAVARQQVLDLGSLTETPRVFETDETDGDLRAIYFEALPWQGKPTRVFAWLGIPENTTGKLPGVVLVHGGGGTAFKEWVEKWNSHGFAAISIAVEGQTDKRAEDRKGWQRHSWAGPQRDGIYGDSANPLKDQWMYHAVADTGLANTLLRSLPEVDSENVGVAGISWGGVITSTVIGIDTRFRFAIPTYGCGHLFNAGNQYGRALGNNELYKRVWDPVVRMDRVNMPVQWLSWPGDQHFPLDCQAACYQAAPGPHLVTLIPGMKHGHGAGWNPPDSYAFAQSIIDDGKPWCQQTIATLDGDEVQVTFESTKPFDKASLVWTADDGVTGDREWTSSSAVLSRSGDEWTVSASLPPQATAWFVNANSGKLTASSDFQERRK
ncbi:alpha/beta hydrolase family protein [Aporhodopirellula aestuarii]|uniref:Acetylxylan esterase n=1 Tax=Aporhodopirellula aestuarii TaxID=2950107 RepID=A0ABT0TZ03_9BACT|nr:acetylxylan esterase [Aporhodopirellula aestuarii]MCM2369842.1 acetylxylan esterase [Aporhodopirellula aestuarii]